MEQRGARLEPGQVPIEAKDHSVVCAHRFETSVSSLEADIEHRDGCSPLSDRFAVHQHFTDGLHRGETTRWCPSSLSPFVDTDA